MWAYEYVCVCIACTYEASLCINVGVYLNVYAYVDVYANVSCVYRLLHVKSLSTHMCVVLCGGALQCVAVCCSRWHMYTCRVTHGKETRQTHNERWRAGVETQKNVRGEIGGWGRVPFNEPYAPLLSTIYDGA